VTFYILLVILILIMLVVGLLFIYIDYTIPWQFWQDTEKHYLVPFCPYIPLISIVINCYMIASLSIDSFTRVVGWMFIGLLIYIFFYGFKHSALNINRQLLLNKTMLLSSLHSNSKLNNNNANNHSKNNQHDENKYHLIENEDTEQ